MNMLHFGIKLTEQKQNKTKPIAVFLSSSEKSRVWLVYSHWLLETPVTSLFLKMNNGGWYTFTFNIIHPNTRGNRCVVHWSGKYGRKFIWWTSKCHIWKEKNIYSLLWIWNSEHKTMKFLERIRNTSHETCYIILINHGKAVSASG